MINTTKLYNLGPATKNMDDLFNSPPLSDFFQQEQLSTIGQGTESTGKDIMMRRALLRWAGAEHLADRVVDQPTDIALTKRRAPGQGDARVKGSAPIAYDVWYLFAAGNAFRFGGVGVEDTIAKMKSFFDAVSPIKPLLMQADYDDVWQSYDAIISALFSITKGTYDTIGNVIETAKSMRFEVYTPENGSPAYDSKGPKTRQNDYAGYLFFPVGPMGVNYTLSIITETLCIGDNVTSDNIKPVSFTSADILTGGDIIPPWKKGVEDTPGINIMAKGYVVSHPFMANPDDERFVEYLADNAGGAVEFHKNLRFWLSKDSTWVWPGEFVALLCRPMPTHCWWYQETSPYIYAGNWMETEFYTSGIVKAVLEPTVDEDDPKDFDPEDGEVGNRYKVWVKNEEIIVKSSDFLEYEVDERVGLLKTYREEEGSDYSYFKWEDLALQETGETLNTEWVIVPVVFYSTESGLG